MKEVKDKTVLNRTILAIGICGITMASGFWIGYLIFSLVMS